MNRRSAGLALLLGLAFGAAPLAAESQQAGKVYRIGYLSAPTRESVARARCILAKVTRARLDRWPKPHHRVPMGRGEDRATARPRGRAGAAQGRSDRRARRVLCS